MFKERVKRTILGVSGHVYAVLAVDEAGVMHGTSPGYGWRQAKSRDEVRTGFSTKAVRLFGALGRDRIHVKAVEHTNSGTFVEFLKDYNPKAEMLRWRKVDWMERALSW